MNNQKTDMKENEKSGGCCCASKDQSQVEKEGQSLQSNDLPLHTLTVNGAKCGGCVRKIEAALKSVSGVEDARMNLSTGIATASGDVVTEALVSVLGGAGYSAATAE